MSVKYFMTVILSCSILFALAGCGVVTSNQFYYEPTTDRTAVNIKRIAIVPNRLPLNLSDPEKWRQFNWQVAADVFTKNGYEVVEYQSSLQAFEKSGLPVEDTKSSRDKFAELAGQLGVDAIVVPYYGTFATAKSALVWTSMSWDAVVTFQFYLPEKDDFISRLDASGRDRYTSGLLSLVGIGLMVAGDEDLQSAGLIVQGVGFLIDLSQTMLRSNDSHWRAAFRKAIQTGLEPFLSTYTAGPGTPGGTPKESDMTVPPIVDSNSRIAKPAEQASKTAPAAVQHGRSTIEASVTQTKIGRLWLDKGSSEGVQLGFSANVFESETGQPSGEGVIIKVEELSSILFVSSNAKIKKGDKVVINVE